VNIRLGSDTQLGVAAGPMQANEAKVYTAIRFAVAACITGSAANDRLDDHTIAALELLHFVTDFDNVAAHFMSADERIICIRVVPGVVLHVTGADASGYRSDDDIA